MAKNASPYGTLISRFCGSVGFCYVSPLVFLLLWKSLFVSKDRGWLSRPHPGPYHQNDIVFTIRDSHAAIQLWNAPSKCIASNEIWLSSHDENGCFFFRRSPFHEAYNSSRYQEDVQMLECSGILYSLQQLSNVGQWSKEYKSSAQNDEELGTVKELFLTCGAAYGCYFHSPLRQSKYPLFLSYSMQASQS